MTAPDPQQNLGPNWLPPPPPVGPPPAVPPRPVVPPTPAGPPPGEEPRYFGPLLLPPRKHTRTIVAASLGCLTLTVVAALSQGAPATSPTSSPAAPPATTAPARTPAPAAPAPASTTAPAATKPATTAPAKPATPAAAATTDNAATRVVAWYNSGGKDYISTIGADNQAISRAAKALDVPGMTAACDTLRTDVVRAQTGRAIPDAQAQDHWGKALDFYEEAALDCYTGGTLGQASLIDSSSQEMQQGTQEIEAATDRIRELQAG